MNEPETIAYLTRIGAAKPVRPDLHGLRELQERHLLAVPFENLSIGLGEAVELHEEALVDKLVGRRRGGFCYELNGAFGALLTALGFQVQLLEARVFGARSLGPPYDHLALRVELEEPWLVDVGFGRFSRLPLRLQAGDEQSDAEGTFIIQPALDGDVDVHLDGVPQYRLGARPRRLSDFEATCWWHQTSPRSHFTQSTVCSLLTSAGRVTISDRRLLETSSGVRTEIAIGSDAELLDAYRQRFGIDLERVPLAPHPAANPSVRG